MPLDVSRLSVSNESCLKGLMALLIILSHSAWAGKFTIWGYSLAGYNYLPVGIFFFLSGFGLFEQYKKGKDFKFLKKAFTLLLPYWILCGLWYPFFTNRSWSGELVFEIILGDAFLPFSWYVKTQLVCYFL